MSNIKHTDEPLAESSVSLRLSLIQKRCRELADDELSLSLEDGQPGAPKEDSFNPYDRG